MQAPTPQRHVSLIRYLEALESDETEDSEVQFVVLACDEKGNELPEGEIGVARCSLEQLVSEGKDHSGPLSIIGTSVDGVSGAKLGELTCTVGAIAALTPFAVSAGRAPVSALASKLAAKAVVTVGATAATITSASAKPAKKTPVKLLIMLGGQPTVEPLATAEGSLGVDGSCTFSLSHSIKVSAGAEVTRALLLALDAPPARTTQPPTPLEVLHGRQGTIRFELHATDKKGGVAPGTAPLALGVVDMGALLDENKVLAKVLIDKPAQVVTGIHLAASPSAPLSAPLSALLIAVDCTSDL